MSVAITLRADKGTALTNAEMDANFANLAAAADALQGAGSSLVYAHLFEGDTAGEQIIAAIHSLNNDGADDLTSPVVVDCRGLASPAVLEDDITSALTTWDRAGVVFVWGAQEVRVAVTQGLRSHIHHVLNGARFVAKDEAGVHVSATMFAAPQDGGIGGGGNGVITTDGSAVITKVSPAAAAWARLEVGSPIGVFGFVSPLGTDNWQLDGALDNSQTTLTFDTTTGMEDAGYLRVEDELISYAAKTGTTVTGCVRGFAGTTAASHLDNTAVYRPTYQPFYVKSIDGDDITLDGTIDFTAANASIYVGHLDISFTGVGVIDGDYDPTTDDTSNPYGIQVLGGRHVFIGAGIHFQHHDHGGVDLEQTQDSTILASISDGGFPALTIGGGFWLFAWCKRCVIDCPSADNLYIAITVDDRSTTPTMRDGTCEDCVVRIRHGKTVTKGIAMQGTRRCKAVADVLTDLPASGVGIDLGDAQWITAGIPTENILDVGLVRGASGFKALVIGGVNGYNHGTCRTRNAPSTVAAGNVLEIFEHNVQPTYSASIATDASVARHYQVVITNGTPFTLANPTNLSMDCVLHYELLNSSGGAAGAVTFGSAGLFKTAGAFTMPANGTRRTIAFKYNGTNLVEIHRSPADLS